MTVLGQWMIFLAAAASGLSALGYALTALGRSKGPLRPPLLAAAGSLFIILASAFLLSLILLHDFTNGYVFSYSDRSLPLHFLISTFYAGQEGSFLFWTFCSSIIALILLTSSRRRNTEPWVMAVYMAVQTGLVLLVMAKSPFRYLWEMFPQAPVGTIPGDGRGLNPLLENFWMVIHPPITFLGFAAMAAPFSLAMASLWKRDYALLVRQGFPWLLFAGAVLGAGLMLGGYWAYGVLGWGGYWGWDPVENSSLVPWLTAVALLHTLLGQRRTGKFMRTNVALALVTFLLVVYSTFLTRSGILGDASVHAFSDPGAGVYWLLLGSLTLIAGTSAAMMARRWREMAPASHDTLLLTRESALGAGTIALLLSALVVLFGTSLPIFSKTRVEGTFYDTTNLPIAIAIVLLIGLSLHTQWEFQDGREILRRALRALSVGLVAGIAFFLAGVHDIPLLILAVGCVFALAVNVEIALKTVRGDWRFLGGKIAHIGIALFLLGVVASGRYATTERLVLPEHQPVQALDRTFTFTGSTVHPDGKTGFRITVDEGSRRFDLEPVMFETRDQGVAKNPDIASFLTRDIYVSPLGVDAEPSGLESYTVAKGEAVDIGGARVRFLRFDMTDGHGSAATAPAVGSVLEISRGGASETIVPVSVPGAGPQGTVHSAVLRAGIQLVSMKIGMGEGSTVTLQVNHDGAGSRPAAVVIEASVKPFVNLLWTGTLVMLAGFALAFVKRSGEAPR